MAYVFDLTLKVRDYECDLQGIVNNANYQHYIEHTRHEFLRSQGVSFADLHHRGIDAVVARLQMSFKTPLRSGDEFVSRLALRKEGIKYVFYQEIFRTADRKLVVKAGIKYVFVQDIFRLPDMKPVLRSTVDTVCLVNGRLSDCEELNTAFQQFFS